MKKTFYQILGVFFFVLSLLMLIIRNDIASILCVLFGCLYCFMLPKRLKQRSKNKDTELENAVTLTTFSQPSASQKIRTETGTKEKAVQNTTLSSTFSQPSTPRFTPLSRPSYGYKWTAQDHKETQRITKYCVVDVETTGLNYTDDCIIEIAVIKCENDQIVNSFSSLVNPNRPIPKSATEINGISDRDVKDAPSADQIAGRVFDILNGEKIIGHNVTFDLNFILKMFFNIPKYRGKFHPEYIDTVTYARQIVDSVDNYKLGTLLDYFHIDPGTSHRAEHDALATQQLFVALKGEYLRKKENEARKRKEKREKETTLRRQRYSKSPLLEKSFCFSGTFSYEREELFDIVRGFGGLPREQVSSKTNYLVLGDISELPDWAIERKKGKAEEMQAQGNPIEIITEEEFYEMNDEALAALNAKDEEEESTLDT